MTLRHFLGLFLGLLSFSFAPAQEPWAVITGQSVVEVRAGLRHIYQRLGRKDLVAAMDSAAVTDLVTGNLKGLDLHRPLGCVVLPSPSKEGTGRIITFIPCTGEQEFLEFLRRHLLTVNTDEQGRHTVTVPLLGKLYIRFDQKHAWLSWSAEDSAGTLPDVNRMIPVQHLKTQLAATIYLERLPKEQRHQFLKHGQSGLDWLLKGDSQPSGQLMETLGLPIAGALMKRLAEDARELSVLASSDRRSDQLWGKIVITPRPDVAWMAEVQKRAANPARVELPVSLWAKVRGKTEEEAQRAQQTAFKNGESDKLILTVQGGEQLELKGELSGALLAYHAALQQDGSKPEKKPTRRERRRIPPR